MTRPLDTWRVCGQPVADAPGSDCTCTTSPNRWAAQRALARLNSEMGGPMRTAPRAAAGAGRAHRDGT